MTTWKITFNNDNGNPQELIFDSKKNMIEVYLDCLNNRFGWNISELKAWKNERDYTEALNKFLEK